MKNITLEFQRAYPKMELIKKIAEEMVENKQKECNVHKNSRIRKSH